MGKGEQNVKKTTKMQAAPMTSSISKKGNKPKDEKLPAKKLDTEGAKKSIDDLFCKLKKVTKQNIEKEEQEKEAKQKKREARKLIKKEENMYKTDENGVKYTEEGYRIYTVEELNIGKGGDTADCPFDCNCCF